MCGIGCCKTRMQCADAKGCAIEDGNGKAAGNFAPVFPAVKARQIIRAHEPYESTIAAVALQKADAIDGVMQLMLRLDIEHADARVVG